MTSAFEFARLGHGVFLWEAYEPTVKADLVSCAVKTPAGLVFIDPIPLAEAALEELLAEGPAAAIVVTNGNHLRAAPQLAGRFRLPIQAHTEAIPELGADAGPVQALGQEVEGLRVIELLGGGAGEVALFSPARTLHLGDAIVNTPDFGFILLPEKYCEDAPKLRAAARQLPALNPVLVTFAHGIPLTELATERLASLVNA